jgi:phosphoserine phosphatase
MTTTRLVLVSLSGPDRPGILGEVTAAMAEAGFGLVDIQQATLLDLLALSLLVDCGPAPDPVKRVLRAIGGAALSLGLKVDARELGAGDPGPSRARDLYALTILSEGLDTQTVSRLASLIGAHRANIVTIHRLAESDLSAVDFILDVTETRDLSVLKTELLLLSDVTGVDIGLQPENAYRKSKRLVVFDVDSTLLEGEAIDELAREAGQGEAVAAITKQAMDGHLDFASALRKRVKFLAGLSVEYVDQVGRTMKLTPGAEETIRMLKELGFRVAAISGGFDAIVNPLMRRLGLDHAHANTLETVDGKLTGRVVGEIIDPERKASLLKALAACEKIPLDQVVGVGDGANDIPMMQAAGLGVAFGSRDKPRHAAHGSIRRNDLKGILYLLGVTGSDLRRLGDRIGMPERRQS